MFFILLLLLSLRQTYALSSFGLFLVRYKLDCFVEPLKTGERLDFHYEVMSSTGSTAGGKDSDLLIGFHIKGPNGAVIFSAEKEQSKGFGFNAESDGTYQICLSNEHSGYEKYVTFSIIGPDEHQKIADERLFEDTDNEEDQKEVTKNIQELGDAVRYLRDEQSFLVRRLERHGKTANSTNSRVFWWSLLQLLIVGAVCVFQVMYLRRFFESRRVV